MILSVKRWFLKHEAVLIFATAAAFRIFIYLLSIMVMIGFENYENGYGFVEFLNGWKRWDGSNYVVIAREGYSYLVEGRPLFLVFYPGYPYLMRALNLIIPNLELCGLLISAASYSLGCVVLYRLVCLDHSKRIAANTVILLSLFPFSYFFGAIMTESLYFLLSAVTLYMIRKHNWFLAALAGAAACFTRSTGVLLALVLLMEMCYSGHPFLLLRRKNFKLFFIKLLTGALACMVMAAGTVCYLLINASVTGNPFQFLTYQKEHWGQGTGNILNTISYMWYYFTSGRYESNGVILWGPQLVLLAVSVTAVLYSIRNLRITYTFYLIVYTLLIFSLTWLLSAGRYMSCAIPLFMAGGVWMERHKQGKTVLLCFSSMLFMLFFIAYNTGRSAF